jgi:hypothetical protein
MLRLTAILNTTRVAVGGTWKTACEKYWWRSGESTTAELSASSEKQSAQPWNVATSSHTAWFSSTGTIFNAVLAVDRPSEEESDQFANMQQFNWSGPPHMSFRNSQNDPLLLKNLTNHRH